MTSRYRGALAAPELPEGLEWLNASRPLSLKELRGKIVLLEFWTFCDVNCRQNSALLARLRARFPHEMCVVGVHSGKYAAEKSVANLRQAVMRSDILYPVVNDPDFRIWKQYNVVQWPTVVLLDPLGGIVLQEIGPIDTDKYQTILKTMVADFDKLGVLDRKPLTAPALPALVLPEEIAEPERVLKYPSKLVCGAHSLYLSDTGHNRVLEIQLDGDGLSGEVLRVFGQGRAALEDGGAARACFSGPRGLALDRGHQLYVADTDNHAIRAIDLGTGAVTTLVGTGRMGEIPPTDLGGQRSLRSPWALALMGDLLFVAMAGFHQVWVVVEPGVSNQAGPFVGRGRPGREDGSASESCFSQPRDLALAPSSLLVCDSGNDAVRRVTWLTSPRVETVVGEGETQSPSGLAWGEGVFYLADTCNHKLKVYQGGQLRTLAGEGPGYRDGKLSEALFYELDGLALSGNRLYLADTNNHAIRVVDLGAGLVHTLSIRGLDRLAPTPHRRPPAFLEPRSIAGGPTQLIFELKLPEGYRRHPEVPLSLRSEWYGHVQHFRFGSEQRPEAILNLFQEGPLNLELTLYYCPQGDKGKCLIQNLSLMLPIKVNPSSGTTLVIPHVVGLEPAS